MDPTTNPQQMMEIEIKFAKGKVDYVIVHYGDDPITLAKEFVTKHNLKPSSVQIIAQYIESTVFDFIQTHQNEEKSNIESDGTNRQSEEKYEDSRRPSEDQRPPRKDKIERNRSESEAPSAIMSKDDYKSPLSAVSNSRSVDNHSSYFKENSMPDRVPPTTPGMRKGEREQHDHAFSSKANSIRSIADDVSNDTTVPNNNLNRDALEQSQYGNVSERSSFYNHTQAQSQTPQRYGNNNTITRSSPSLSQSLLDSSQALKKSNQKNPNNRDEDDNNTIDKIVEKNLFISEPTRSTDDAAKRPESKRKPTVTEYDESMSGKPRKEKIAEGANPRYSTNQQNNSRPTSISKASRDEEYFSNQPSTRNIRGQSVTASDYIAQEEERKFFANAADDEDDEEDASPEYAENPNDVHKYDSRVDVDEDQAPLEDGEGNIVSYDDYTFRSDLDSLTKTDQNTLTTNPSAFNYDVAEHEDEDPEAKYNRLKYGTLKRAQTAVTVQTARTAQTSQSTKSVIKTTLKPATKSLQMGKQKLLSPQSQSQKLSNSKAEKEKLVGKTVNERLYYNAELMKKKKDLIIMKNEEKKMAELENEKFRLNEGSQKIIETIQSRNYGDNNSQCTNASDIGQKLYLDGINALENKKKKLEKVNKLKEKFIDSWSCVKCGTFHKVSASQTITNTPQMWGANSYDKYRCSNCCFNNQDSIESFKPTNVGLLLNEEMKENVEKNRKQHMISTTNNTTNIHEHLYQQGKQHEQMLALNRALWEDLNEKMSFKPNISEKSKAIIKSYQQQPGSAQNSILLGGDSFDNDVTKGSTLENEDNDEITSMQQKINNTKITGQNMKEYFSKPTFDRLISTNTRSFVDETIAFHNRNQLPPNLSAGRSTFANSRLSGSEASTVNTQVSNLPNKAKQDQFVNRLVNEYKEKGQRMDERTNKYYTYDVNTGQKLWKPKIPAVPEEYGVKILSSSSNDSKRDIWNDILRRDKELLEEKLKKQKDTIEKTLQEIQKNQVKALPSSNEILQHSTQKNLEDLYKLLLVNTHPLNDTIVSTDDEGDEQERDGEESSVKQPPPNPEEEFAFGNPDGRGQKLRMDMLKPTNSNVNNNQDEAASNYSFLQDNNTIVSEKQLNEVITNYLSNWKEKKLDLLLIKPNLLINEISTLLLDMKYHVFNRWQSKQRLKLLQEKNDAAKAAALVGAGSSKSAKSTTARSKIDEGEEYRDDGNDDLENIRLPGEGGEDDDGNDKDNNQLLMTHPQELLISYEEFVKLAGKCIKKRSGPGKGYIFAPKKKADIAIQMKLEEYSEETFHPEIGKNSEAIIQKQRQQLLQQNQLQNNNFNEKVPILPIEDILTEDGKRIQKKIEILRQEKFAQEEAQLTFKPFLYKPPSYVVPRYRGLDISEFDDQENHQNNGIDEGELASNFSGRGPDDENFSGLSNIMGVSSTYHHPESLRTSHLSNATTAKAFHSSNNTVGSNTIFDIPNVTIGNKQATGAISGGGGAIRGGGGGAGKNVSGGNTSVVNSIPNGSSVTQAVSSKDTRSVASNITNSDALSSPSTKGPIQANELMTPPHVRQTRLLNQTNFPPPPGPAPAPAASTAGNNNQNNNNSNNVQKMGASEDTQDSKNTHSLNNKDDSSIFTLTESAASIPGKTFEDSRTMSEKKKQLDRLNAKNNQQQQQQHHQQQPPSSQQNSSYSASYSQQNSEKRLISKKSAQHVLRLDSSSLESYSPPMSLSSASQVEEGGRYSQMSAEFPSKFSAVSDVSHQAFQSSSEIDDHHQQQQRRPPPNKSGAVGGGGYSKAPLSATSINVRKPTVHPNAPLPPPLPATGGGAGAGVSSSNQSIESGYSGNLSSVNSSAPEGYSKQLVTSHHPAAKGSAGANNKPSGYLKASGVGKSLPLLPHEVHRHAPGKGSSAAGGQQKKPEGRYSLDTDSYYSDENSTISTESSTIVRSRKI